MSGNYRPDAFPLSWIRWPNCSIASGKTLQSADSAPGSDLTIERRLHNDEQVYVTVKQSILNYFGPAYTYRLLVREGAADFLRLPPEPGKPAPKQMAGSDRIYLARGSQFAVPLKIQWAEGFEETGASIHVDAEGLPEGVTVDPLVVTAADGKREKEKSPLAVSKDLVFHAAANASLGVGAHPDPGVNPNGLAERSRYMKECG